VQAIIVNLPTRDRRLGIVGSNAFGAVRQISETTGIVGGRLL
jgi:hypothetical protein